ncbi:MAG: T9SS type A sorting domain-containing protein [Ignavibacteriaceae bacterium]
MFTQFKKFILILILSLGTNALAQDISVVQNQSALTDSLNSEMIFTVDVTNLTQVDQIIFVVRTINDLPDEWFSALCFDYCFSFETDSIATTPGFPFFSSPLEPGETREVAIHVFPFVNPGTANLQIQVGTFSDPNNRFTLDFVATVQPTSVTQTGNQPNNYFLAQNYPNPFNPSTKINFGLKEAGYVSVKVYNILGNEIATLVNGYYSAGNYTADFNASAMGRGLSSGVYFYRINVNGYSEIRKMILEK